MRRVDCPHEPDVLSAVYTNRWPRQVSDDLRDHVFTCRICADVIVVASAFENEADPARAGATVPDASIVWWRAQLRARHEAAREAMRPITVAQAIGLAAAVGGLGAIFGATATWFQETLRGIWGVVTAVWPSSPPSLPSLSLPDALSAPLAAYGAVLGGVVLFVMLASLAVYVALRATEN